MRLARGTAAAALALASIGPIGMATADPGHSGDRRGPERHGVGVQHGPEGHAPRPCHDYRDIRVGYVFRGTVHTAAADAVTVDLSGANAHARRVLARATPPIIITRDAATDLLRVPTPAGTRVFRNGYPGVPRVGDQVRVKYRAPHSGEPGKRCVVNGAPVVTVSGSPAVATLTGGGVVLTWVGAWGPA